MQTRVRFAVLCPANVPHPARGWRRGESPAPFHSDVLGSPGRPGLPTPYGLELLQRPGRTAIGAELAATPVAQPAVLLSPLHDLQACGCGASARAAGRATRWRARTALTRARLRTTGHRWLLVVEPHLVPLVRERHALCREPALLRSWHDAPVISTHPSASAGETVAAALTLRQILSAMRHADRDRSLACSTCAADPNLDRDAAEPPEEKTAGVLRVEQPFRRCVATERQADAARYVRKAVVPVGQSPHPEAVVDERCVPFARYE